MDNRARGTGLETRVYRIECGFRKFAPLVPHGNRSEAYLSYRSIRLELVRERGSGLEEKTCRDQRTIQDFSLLRQSTQAGNS